MIDTFPVRHGGGVHPPGQQRGPVEAPGAPASVVLTLGESKLPALGSGSRPAYRIGTFLNGL